MGASILTNSITVNNQPTCRNQEYFRQQIPANNTNSALWTNITVSGGQVVSGNVYVPQQPENFQYDADGNLTNDGRWQYVWDAENRLITMIVNTNIGPQYTLTFAYDPEGRRISKVVSTNGVGIRTNIFLYDGWNLVATVSPSDALINSFMWGPDLSGQAGGAPNGAGGVGGLLEATYYGTSTTNCFPAYDGNGNIMALVNAANGQIVANYEYGPFGEVIRATGPMAKANPFRWSTQYQDDETDLVCYLHRYYSPSTGRWLSQDPVGEPGFRLLANPGITYDSGPNLYGFVGNSPTSFVDELGLGYGNPVSGPDGPVGPSDPYAPGGPYYKPYVPPPPTCSEACFYKYILGIEVDTTVVVSGQPILSKRFVTPGSAEGTSIAGKMTDAVLGDMKLPTRLPTLTRCCRLTATKSASRFVSRWIPFVGWAMLTYDASGLAGCLCGCNGI